MTLPELSSTALEKSGYLFRRRSLSVTDGNSNEVDLQPRQRSGIGIRIGLGAEVNNQPDAGSASTSYPSIAGAPPPPQPVVHGHQIRNAVDREILAWRHFGPDHHRREANRHVPHEKDQDDRQDEHADHLVALRQVLPPEHSRITSPSPRFHPPSRASPTY